jgi:hypothetical protein
MRCWIERLRDDAPIEWLEREIIATKLQIKTKQSNLHTLETVLEEKKNKVSS